MDVSSPHPPVSPEPKAMDRGYEADHVNARGVAWFVVWFVVTAAVIHLLLWFMLKRLERPVREIDQPLSAVRADRPTGGGPPLQPSVMHDSLPREDLAGMRRGEDEVFAHMGWTVDPGTHRVSVPDSVIRAVVSERGTKGSTRPASGKGGGA
jgi:hypothetical protein